MENNEKLKQLLIIGNGFDLACGLKSSYKDFLGSISNKEYENNFWYYIFYRLENSGLNHSDNWADIELQILKQLKNLEILYKDNFIHTIYKHTDTIEYISINKEKLKEENDIIEFDSNSLEITYSGIKATKNSHIDIPKTIEEAQTYLLQHLRVVETDFCNFLSNQINEERNKEFYLPIPNKNDDINHNNYYVRSIKLLNHILKLYYSETTESVIDSESNRTKKGKFTNSNGILSFNYTLPVLSFNWVNIHGSLECKNIIFGINYDSLNSYFRNPPIQYSKSYRILENSILSNIRLSKDIKNILFYGHGLGEADYPYFQSIFDSIDLYHCNTRLIFFWDAYDENRKLELHQEILNKVVNLIERYGQTFSNKDHGRNLLTKLKIENRILIKEICPKKIFEKNIQQ